MQSEGVFVNKKDVKHIGLRVSPEMHRKLVYIAEYDARSVNGLTLNLLSRCIRDFEREHGPITEDDLKEDV